LARFGTHYAADFSLRLQDPGAPAGHLLGALLEASRDAERGGGIFAFATADGIEALLGNGAFEVLLRTGTFDVVVGVDSVTDTRALDALDDCVNRHENVTARVLVHDESVLFHPKLSWFVGAGRMTLVVGSGNLTVRGLRENWEAFAVVELEGDAAKRVEAELAAWLARHAALLRPPRDAVARERAARNTGRERDLKHPKRAVERDVLPNEALALVAEAPKSGMRPSQVNFDKGSYEKFFGAREGSESPVALRCVGADGTVGEVEIRPVMIRKSRNYSFELTGFRGGRREGQPPDIGVYVRLPQGTFLYQRVRFPDAGYPELDSFLKVRWRGGERFMRRVIADADDIRAAWPGSPLWTAEIPSS
jgi:hypothetical protein